MVLGSCMCCRMPPSCYTPPLVVRTARVGEGSQDAQGLLNPQVSYSLFSEGRGCSLHLKPMSEARVDNWYRDLWLPSPTIDSVEQGHFELRVSCPNWHLGCSSSPVTCESTWIHWVKIRQGQGNPGKPIIDSDPQAMGQLSASLACQAGGPLWPAGVLGGPLPRCKNAGCAK